MMKIIRANSQSIYIGSILISIGMIVARVVAFYREFLLISSENLKGTTDLFYVAFTITDFLYFLFVGGLLGATFVPFYSKEKVIDSYKAWDKANILFTYLVTTIFVLTIVFLIKPTFFLSLLTSNNKVPELLLNLTYFLVPSWFLIIINGFLISVINVHKDYMRYSTSLIFNNIVMIILILIGKSSLGIYAFPLGIIGGNIVQFFILVRGLRKENLKLQFTWKFDKALWSLILRSLPVILCLGYYQLSLILFQRYAFEDDGVITAFKFFDKIVQLFFGVLIVSYVTAAYPVLAEKYTNKNKKEFQEFLEKVLANLSLKITFIFFSIYFLNKEVVWVIKVLVGNSVYLNNLEGTVQTMAIIFLCISLTFFLTRIYLIFEKQLYIVIVSLFSLIVSCLLYEKNFENITTVFLIGNILYSLLIAIGLLNKIEISKRYFTQLLLVIVEFITICLINSWIDRITTPLYTHALIIGITISITLYLNKFLTKKLYKTLSI